MTAVCSLSPIKVTNVMLRNVCDDAEIYGRNFYLSTFSPSFIIWRTILMALGPNVRPLVDGGVTFPCNVIHNGKFHCQNIPKRTLLVDGK